MHNRLLKCFFNTLAAFAMVFLSFAPSWSADWAVSPYFTLVEEYNDNILFSRKGQELDDFVTYVRPRVEIRYGTDRLSLSWDSGLEREIYADYDELNTTDHDHKLALSYGLSRTLGLRAGGYFREDTTLETELAEEGLLAQREDRRKFGTMLGFDYAFSPLLILSGDWTHHGTEYPTDDDQYPDRRSDTLKLAPRYVLSPLTSLFLNLVYTRTEYGKHDDPKIHNYNISPSFRHDFAENFYVAGGAGYRYTENKTGDEYTTTDGFIFDLSFHRDWKKVSMALLASRDQYSTVYGRSIERNRLTLQGTYRLSDRLRSSLSATFRTNRVDEGTGDTDYYTISPALMYKLTPNIGLKGSVDYSEYDYKDINADDRERFRARVTLDFNWPRLWSGH
ncbi:MAG: outer membrane beta-barrel protein [Pseudomonadota bacterium]